jgi:hypothetical protein
MGPALTDAELAALYPHLEPWQRRELEQWHRGQAHARMEDLEPPGLPAPPWPERSPEL